MVDKDLNLLMNVLLDMYISPLKKQVEPLAWGSKMYGSDSITN